jgi:hypothetical protein
MLIINWFSRVIFLEFGANEAVKSAIQGVAKTILSLRRERAC